MQDQPADTPRSGGLGDTRSGLAQQLNYIGGAYRVLHGKRVKSSGSPQVIDHLVIGPNGIFHISVNPASGEIRLDGPGSATEDSAGADLTAPLYRHEFVLKELLREHKLRADVVGIVCFTNPDSRLVGTAKAFVALGADRVVSHIQNHRPTRTLSPADVASIEQLILENSE
ncbi:nuclease-related domain-containing protein [Paenibacillus filicis]|uniref:Nuclease-related domain-containing protein n=1 Tax=Paenibacillus filicis TaxID=669464 RepID=A0ABU9DTJ8_9BACL